MKIRNILKNRLFRSILISYIAVCAVLLLLTAAGYMGSASYLKTEIERSAGLRLSEVVTQMKNKIEQTYKICDTLAVSTDLAGLGSIRGDFTAEEILSSMELRDAMGRINLQNNLYDNPKTGGERGHGFFLQPIRTDRGGVRPGLGHGGRRKMEGVG